MSTLPGAVSQAERVLAHAAFSCLRARAREPKRRSTPPTHSSRSAPTRSYPGRWGRRLPSMISRTTLFHLRQLVTVPDDAASFGTLTRVRGSSWTPSAGSVLRLEGLRLVRVQAVEPGDPLPIARVEPVEPRRRRARRAGSRGAVRGARGLRRARPALGRPAPPRSGPETASPHATWPGRTPSRSPPTPLGLAYADRLALAQQSDADQVTGLAERLRRSAASSS